MQQLMIENGANPFILDGSGNDNFTAWNLARSNLSNLPTKKSVYYTIRPPVVELEKKGNFCDPWFYRTGVFGKFDSVIGRGASGVVVSGEWFDKKAAFKFVETGNQSMLVSKPVRDALEVLDKKLSEMTTIQTTKGSKIVSFYGHYR